MFLRLFLWAIVLTSGHCTTAFNDDIFPLNLKYCKTSGNNYSTCFINAIQDSWPTFAKGVPALEFSAFDPLKIEKIEENLKIGPFTSHILLMNIKLYGLANATFLQVHPKFTNSSIELDLYLEIPKIVMNGNYKANGVCNFFFYIRRIRGGGPFNINMEHVTSKWSIKGNIENDRWVIEHFDNDLEVKGMKVHFGNLFDGNTGLDNAVEAIINQGWPIFFRDLKPVIREVSNALMVNILNRDIFSKVSASEIFPV